MSLLIPKLRVDEWGSVPLLFFAGPVRGGGDWQMRAYYLAYQHTGGQFCAAVPMRYARVEPPHPLMSEVLTGGYDSFTRQLAWERHYLEIAGLAQERKPRPGCIMFWLGLESEENPHPGPEPYAMDTRRELGEWMALLRIFGSDAVRLVIGANPNFHGLDVIKHVYGEAAGESAKIHDTLEATVEAAIARATRPRQ